MNPSRILGRDAGGKPVSATSDIGQFHGVTGAFLTAPAAKITRATSIELASPSGSYDYHNMNGFAQTINYLAGLNNGSVANDDFKTTQSVWMAMATGTYSRMFAIGNHHTGNSAGSVSAIGWRAIRVPARSTACSSAGKMPEPAIHRILTTCSTG